MYDRQPDQQNFNDYAKFVVGTTSKESLDKVKLCEKLVDLT